MIWLILSALCLVFGLDGVLRQGLPRGKLGLALEQLRKVKDLIQDLEDLIQSGVLPRTERWEALRDLPAPWSPVLSESLLELRSCGGAVLPTLKRMHQLARSHEKTLLESRARSAQAWAQAWIGVALIPLFSATLYVFLPGLEFSRFEWFSISLISLLPGLAAALWILRLSEIARWGGLSSEERSWILPVLCFGERILALLQSGNASDVAWTRSLEALPPALQAEWRGSIFEPGPPQQARSGTLSESLHSLGPQVKRAIHASLIEGRPCFERIELVLQGFQIEMKAHQDRELQLLATRALKPLFVCVAPAIFLLVISGLFMSFQSVELA